jgi:hypothetical protein
MYIHARMYIGTCPYVYMSICIYVHMYICPYVYMSICIYLNTCTYVRVFESKSSEGTNYAFEFRIYVHVPLLLCPKYLTHV